MDTNNHQELINQFFLQVKDYIANKCMSFKFDGAMQIEEILNDCFKMKQMTLRVREEDGYWTINGNIEELERLDEVFTFFKALYRHHSLDYFNSTPKNNDDSVLLIEKTRYEE